MKIPVFGVNFGKLGFLAEIELKELPGSLIQADGRRICAGRAQSAAGLCFGRDGKVLIDATRP